MAPPKKTSKPKASPGSSAKRTSATLRSMSGAGFEFEDLIGAWQMVKALSGERAPGIDSVVTQIQAQVSALLWRIDDLLLTTYVAGAPRRLAISAKGNFQVTAAGLPADFVKRAWEHWRDSQGPFNRTTDELALVTLGSHGAFDPTWREVKNACSGTDTATFTQRPVALPLRLNERTNCIEFEHDLASDWARFQFLKQIWTDTPQWAALAGNPLWTNALRMLGQFLLRQPVEIGTAWDVAFDAAEAAKNELAGDILLDALCLDPAAERFLTERVSVLLNVAKYRPSLLKGSLAALLTFPSLFHWDSDRVDQVGYNFIGSSWLQGGQAVFELARDWTLAPHRRQKFLGVVVELLLADDDVARRLQSLLPTWALPEDPKEALQFKLLFAALDWANYRRG